jgi:hypothetical protein
VPAPPSSDRRRACRQHREPGEVPGGRPKPGHAVRETDRGRGCPADAGMCAEHW